MEVHLFGNISSISVSQLCAYNIFTIFWLKSFLVTDCAVFLLREGRSYGLRRGLSLESIVVPDFAVAARGGQQLTSELFSLTACFFSLALFGVAENGLCW